MKLNCPICNQPLNTQYVCKNEHQFYMDDNVLVLLEEQFKIKLETWLSQFELFRSTTIQKLDFEQLPHSGVEINTNLWNARIKDLKIINNNIKSFHKSVLDIGSWNGWLANSLTKLGKEVTAIDYFMHELDGLKAKKHYCNPSWTSIQMDLENLHVLQQQFDVVILNRCFAYFSDYKKLIESSKQLLSPKGLLIVTGLNITNQEAEELTKAKILFKEKYNLNLFFKSSKGYMNRNDLNLLKEHSLTLKLYPNWKNRLKRLLLPQKEVVYYGTYTKIENI